MAIDIINTRRITAPRERVFEAFADPTKLKTWWGPAGFTNTIPEFDFRPGGTWRVIMRSSDGVEFDNVSTFVEVDRPRTVVYEHLEPVHRFFMRMDFREISPAVSELTWTMSFTQTEQNEKLRVFLQLANEQNFDRLCAFLDSERRPV
jgi:uncharacterized protein YndB with AHSA1/START domain